MSEISVIIPSYNHAEFIERTLRSVFSQTLLPGKLIVIDDGSEDDSVKIIKRVLRKCPFENELIARENRGLCATLNEGFAKTSGEYFAYIGSDDLWLPDFLAESIELLEKRKNAVISFGHSFVIDENERIFDRTDNWTEFADGDPLPFLLRAEIFSSPSVVYRRSALEKFEWNENAKLEDYEMYLKLSTVGEFARGDKILSAWRQHGSNTSGHFAEIFPEFIAAQNRLVDELKVGHKELKQIQAELKFEAVANFIRHGERRKAFSILRKNLHGAKSSAQIAKMLFRLAVPQKLFQWNRKRKKQNAIEKYGKLNLKDQNLFDAKHTDHKN